MNNARDELERELGGALTPGLASLGEVDLDALAATISDAKLRQQSSLATAIDDGLTIVPKILRGAVRKALFR